MLAWFVDRNGEVGRGIREESREGMEMRRERGNKPVVAGVFVDFGVCAAGESGGVCGSCYYDERGKEGGELHFESL